MFLMDHVTTVSATEVRRRLYALIDQVGQSHQPVQIHGKRGNAVLLPAYLCCTSRVQLKP
jgi:PHD/YefM family antitoxin component YafN of YafNO toxin-antitoxin module